MERGRHLHERLVGRFSGLRAVDHQVHEGLTGHRWAQAHWHQLGELSFDLLVHVDDLHVSPSKTTSKSVFMYVRKESTLDKLGVHGNSHCYRIVFCAQKWTFKHIVSYRQYELATANRHTDPLQWVCNIGCSISRGQSTCTCSYDVIACRMH